MKLAATIATTAITATTLASSLSNEVPYIVFHPTSTLEERAHDALLPIRPQVGPSESEIRPDWHFYTNFNQTDNTQFLFNQYMSGRTWSDSLYSRSQPETLAPNGMIIHIATLENNYHNNDENTQATSSIPSPGTLTLIGLGALAVARRARNK